MHEHPTDRELRIARGLSLTTREREVLRHVADGLSNDEIAGRIGLSPRTVQTHVASALRKTASRNRAQLAVFAVREGIVPFDPPADDRGKRWV